MWRSRRALPWGPGMNQSTEAGEHNICKGQIGYSCGTLQMPGWGVLAYVLMVGVNNDFEENDMRTFQKVSLMLVCAIESRKSGEIHLSGTWSSP